MAIRDMVSGDAHERSCDSNRLGPNRILSPEGMVSSLVSSRMEFRDSIHSGSIQDWISKGSFTTVLALEVSTPSVHSQVSTSMWPNSCLQT